MREKMKEAERECRWAKEGRVSAERREELARKRAEALESTSVSSVLEGLDGS